MGLKSNLILMILSFFTQKSTRSAKLSSVFAERFSGEGQADFAINKAHKVSLKVRNNLYISCVLMVLSIYVHSGHVRMYATPYLIYRIIFLLDSDLRWVRTAHLL